MSYSLTFYSGFDQATENLTDDQINQVFDVLTEMAQEEQVKPGVIKVARDLWVTVAVEGETLRVTNVSTQPQRA